MKRLSTTARRVIAVAAAAVAGLAISSAAYAATSSGTARTAAASVPRCISFNLGVWVAVDQGNGAAGTIYYPLEFTNLSGHACSLYGFPGVSAVDRNGHQLGSPADWNRAITPHAVILAPGATAHTLLAYHDVVVSTEQGCDPVYSAVQLRVYPPGEYTPTYAAFDLEVCSHAGPVYMTVWEPIIPGVGTING
jgi:Protein of unknown function (DUF4232)